MVVPACGGAVERKAQTATGPVASGDAISRNKHLCVLTKVRLMVERVGGERGEERKQRRRIWQYG